MKRWTVADVMTTDVVVVAEDATYRAVVDLLAERRISAVPVVDATRRAVGVVSEADLLEAEFGNGDRRRRAARPREKGEARTAGELMTAPAVTTRPGTPLTAAVRLMTERGVKRLPVVDEDGVVVGILSRADALKTHLRPDDELRHEIVEEVLVGALWLDPRLVDVGVRDGVVALRGALDRRTLAELTVKLVAAVPGVVAVEDHLTYELDDAELARSRWHRSHPFSATGR